MATTDQRAALPESVTVLFPRQDSGTPVAEPTPYVVTLASLGLATVPATPATFAGSRVIWSSAVAYWEGGGSATNDAELQALADQIATDWYSWQVAPYDVTLQGWVPWSCDGAHDLFVDHSFAAAQTRVTRGPWYDHVEHVLSKGTYGSSPPPGGGGGGGGIGGTTTFVNQTINYGGTTVVNVGGTTNTTYGGSTTTTYNGYQYIQGPTYYPPYSFTTWTANQTNLVLTAGNVRIRLETDQHFRELRSIVPGASPSGRIICIHNVGDYVILIPHEDTGSTAANRILTTTGSVYWLGPGHEVTLVYDATASRWRVSESSDERLGGVEVYGALAASQDNFALDLSKRQHLFDPSANVNITGLANGQPGLRHLLVNQDDTYTITLKQESASSAVGNRFLLPYGEDFVIGPSMAVDVEYDDEVRAWRLVGPYQDVASLIPADQLLFQTVAVAGQDDVVAGNATDTLTLIAGANVTITTNGAGRSVTIAASAQAALTETYIGYGDGDDLLTGTVDLVRVSEGVTRQSLDSDTLPPTMRMVRRRASAGSISTDDVCALWQGWGKVNGTDTILAYVEVTYTGSGTTPEGAIALWGSDGVGIFNRGLICTGDGAILVDDASTPDRLVITNGDGELVNGTIGAGLSLAGGELSATGGTGTVTSVGLSLPSIITVTGSPVTTTGTLTGTLATQSANRVWAGPTSGSAAAPTFRSLVAADLPAALAAAIYPSDSTSVATSTVQVLTLAATSFDSDTIKSGNTLVVPTGKAGKWLVSALFFAFYSTAASRGGSPTGIASNCYIRVNGSVVRTTTFASGFYGELTAILDLAAGDAISIAQLQSSGITLHTWAQGVDQCSLSAAFLGA